MAEENQNESIIKKPQDDGMEMVMNTNLELEKEQEPAKSEKKTGEFRYIKPDSPNGYITDKDEIEYYKYRQQIDIMRNRLLGDYNENGEYVLSDEIIYELKNIKKEVIEQYKTYLFLHSVFPIQGFGKISFFVSVSKLNDGKLKARLVLLEKIDKANGMVTDTQSVVIDEFIDEASPTYYTKMKEQFKIITVDQKNIDDENQDDLKYCRMRKMKLVYLWEQISGEIEKKEKNSFEKKMKILEDMKEKDPNAKILWEQLQKELEKAKIFTNGKSDKNISNNDILSQFLDRNSENPIVKALKDAYTKINKENAQTLTNKINTNTLNEEATQVSGRGSSQQTNVAKNDSQPEPKTAQTTTETKRIYGMGAPMGDSIVVETEKEEIISKDATVENRKEIKSETPTHVAPETSLEEDVAAELTQNATEEQVNTKQNLFNISPQPKQDKPQNKDRGMELNL